MSEPRTEPSTRAKDASGRRAVLRSRAGHILDWPSVDKAMLLAAIPAPFLGLSWFRLGHLLLDPTDEPYLSREVIGPLRTALALYFVLLAILLGIWLAIRRASPEHRGFVLVTVVLWFVATGLGANVVGAFSTPILAAFMAGALSAMLLFERRVATFGVLLGALLLFVPVPFVALGIVPYAPLYLAPPFAGMHPSPTWIFTTSAFGMAILAVPVGLLGAVLARWRKRDEEIHRLARFDGLTDVANRRYFLVLLGAEVERARRYGSKVSLLLLDLDHFKSVNDRFGHQTGDAILVHVARLLSRDVLRRIDVLGRYGGEEFAILLPETDSAGAHVVAERCRRAIAESAIAVDGGEELRITTSMGCATFDPARHGTVDDLVRAVDDALYAAKDGGRDRVVVAPPQTP